MLGKPLRRGAVEQLAVGVDRRPCWVTESPSRARHAPSSYFPEQTLEPGLLVPTRNLTFAKAPMAGWYDVVPRVGSAYDLFGDGKTALRVSINKYVSAQGLQGTYGDTANPVNRLANIVTRSWIDGNGNFVPDCDLTNVLAQDQRAGGGDLCGTVSDTNFGRSTLSLNYDPEVMNGWGKRPYQWEFSASVQRELGRGVSVDAGYFRRWYGNFGVTDNLNLGPADYSQFSVSAPADPRLPDGGGYTVAGFYNLNPDKVSLVPNNYFTLASNYGEQIQRWNGVDFTVNARLRRGMTLQGGVSTGRQETDNCAVIADLPEAALLTAPYCHQKDNFLTDGKFVGTYTVPKIDVTISGLFYSRPGPPLSANRVFLNAEVAPSLGRNLSANAQTVTVNLVKPGTMYGERRNQLDLRLTKNIQVQQLRTGLNFELYNIFNSNTVLTENPTYRDATLTGWRIPTAIMPPRFIKVSVQLDF